MPIKSKHSNSINPRNPANTPYQKISEWVAKSVVTKYQTIEMLMTAKIPIPNFLVNI